MLILKINNKKIKHIVSLEEKTVNQLTPKSSSFKNIHANYGVYRKCSDKT